MCKEFGDAVEVGPLSDLGSLKACKDFGFFLCRAWHQHATFCPKAALTFTAFQWVTFIFHFLRRPFLLRQALAVLPKEPMHAR